MSEILQNLIDSSNLPALTAFLVGLMAAISPCPLATNIAAVSFIAKDMASEKKAFIGSLFYALGRIFSYTFVAALIYFGLSAFNVAAIFQRWGDKVIGPVLIIIALFMLGLIKLDFIKVSTGDSEKWKERLSKAGYWGHFLLGALFALAFCPYSGVLFFGILIPLVIASPTGLLLPPIFGLGTAIPVIIFGFILAFTTRKIGPIFTKIKNLEKIMRLAIGIIFLIIGIYYLQYTFTMIKGYFAPKTNQINLIEDQNKKPETEPKTQLLTTEQIQFKQEYEALNQKENSKGQTLPLDLPENNMVQYADIAAVFELFETGTGLIYFGFPDCPWCRNMLPFLISVAQQYDQPILYFDPKKIRSENTAEYQKLVTILSPYLSEDDNGHKRLYVPDVYFVKKGTIVAQHDGTYDGHDDPYILLTAEQKQTLRDIYEADLKLILE